MQVFPAGIQPDGNVPMGQELTYMIRFQNTGNDTAFMVEVVDTLASVLDPASFEMVGTSHDVEYFVNPDGSMRFLFEDINLLDSTSNEPESHGYVLFKVKPNVGLASGTEATLQAHIFFDFNPPVVTNIAKSTYTQDDRTITQVFTLEKGWNLISLYVQPEETAVRSVFFSCYSSIAEVTTTDKICNTSYPAYLQTLKDISGGVAYLIRATAKVECSVSGIPVFTPFACDLKQGWNMIGCPVNDTPDFSGVLQNANTSKLINYETIWKPEATNNTVIQFTPGKGYFIYTDSNGSILWDK